MKYITAEELLSIHALIEFLKSQTLDLSVSASIIDVNGEVIGKVEYADSGDYAFIPSVTDDE